VWFNGTSGYDYREIRGADRGGVGWLHFLGI
jgi:hypothetical protein